MPGRTAVTKNTKAFFMETPTNPTLEVYDIQAVAEIAHNAGAKLVVDNVFATPLYQSPLTLGADVVVYSATKHIDGQGRVLGGVILGSEKLILDNYHQLLRQTGPSLSPFNCWVMLKGLETLSVRVQRQTETAAAVSTALHGHKKITRLIYPGRADHPQADIVKKQMSGGSTLCSFEIKGGKEGAFRFLNGLSLIGITNNLGDAKSLITHPTTTTHQRLTPAAARRTRNWRWFGPALGRSRAPRRSDRGSADGSGRGLAQCGRALTAPSTSWRLTRPAAAPPRRWPCRDPWQGSHSSSRSCARRRAKRTTQMSGGRHCTNASSR